MNGKVFLVGAGPGDPGLLTLKAAGLIESADVIAIDALVSSEVAALVPETTEIVDVGKRAGTHSMPQDEINALLVREARKGKRVVRLKGGDPFVFGRGGEEAEAIAAAGIDVEVVPGISSAIAGPAYAGIPVTDRRCATSLTIVTGHEAESSTGIDWPVLARLNGTIVFMMGLANLELIAGRLVEFGMEKERAVAVISKATTAEQRTVVGTLATIVERLEEIPLPPPAIVVVGDVVRIRNAVRQVEEAAALTLA